MIELFLCKPREQKRSIVDLCEHFAIRRFVQKEPSRTIFSMGCRDNYTYQQSLRSPTLQDQSRRGA